MLPVPDCSPEPPPVYLPPPPEPSLGQGVWIAVQLQLLPIVVIIPAAIAGIVLHRDKLPEHPVAMLAGSLFAALFVIYNYCRASGLSPLSLAGPVAVRPVLLPLIATGVLGLLFIETPVALWLMVRFPFLDPELDFGVDRSPIAPFLLLVIVAPLTEELIYRAILLRGFVPRYGPSRAVLFAAALFALAHIFPLRLPGMFAAGVLLGWLLLRTGSIWPGVLAHAFNNAVAFVLMLAQPHPKPSESLAELGPWPLPMLLAGAVLLAGAILAARRAVP